MQMVLFIGIQATGKSSFYRERFFNTHVRLSLDLLKTRHREELFLRACLEGKQCFVVDKMNLTRAERQRYMARAKEAGFSVEGYFFESEVGDALRRNRARPGVERVPDGGIFGAKKRLELPGREEGFARLFRVQLKEPVGFVVEEYSEPGRAPGTLLGAI